MAAKQIPIYCPNCNTLIYRLSLDLLKEVREVTIALMQLKEKCYNGHSTKGGNP
jgi:hypothetical protein